GSCLEVVRTGVLGFVVAYAILTRYENHRGGRHPGNIDRIMARTTHHFTVWIAERSRGSAHRVDAFRVETRRRKVIDLLQLEFNANVTSNSHRRIAKLAVHRGEFAVIGMPHVDGHLDEPGND